MLPPDCLDVLTTLYNRRKENDLYNSSKRTLQPQALLSPMLRIACLAAISLATGLGLAQSAAASAGAAPAHVQHVRRAAGSVAHSSDPWWKHAIVYEIYPRSFQDSNGDGIGDLNGITQRLDYLQKLGIDAIWIAPMFPSPQVDFGYDISDYEAIDPQYGTLADFDHLVAAAKKHNIRICLDMVLNHTSDKHKWFMESASSRTNPKSDWYVWAEPKGFDSAGKPIPPNNWLSLFGHSAWEWVPARKQFYYHKFYIQQPDLNWRNPAVEKAIFNMERFWLDRGVAGFRLDAIDTLFEDPSNADEEYTGGTNAYGDRETKTNLTSDLPEVHDVMRRMRKLADSYPGDRVLIGETYLPNIQAMDNWYGGDKRDQLHLPMDMIVGFGSRLNATELRKNINEAETELRGNQPLFVFDNHDNRRSWDRFGDGVHNAEIAKVIATTLLTSRATVLMYYGEELGMKTSTPTRVEDVKDPIGVTGWPKEKGRDGERTPMQWDAGPQAGFSTNPKTWLPVADDYKTVNVKAEESNPASLLHWYKQLIALRRDNPAMHNGAETMLNTDDASVLSYVRGATNGSPAVIVAINCTGEPRTITLNAAAAGVNGSTVKTLLASDPALQSASTLTVTLPPFANWVASVQ